MLDTKVVSEQPRAGSQVVDTKVVSEQQKVGLHVLDKEMVESPELAVERYLEQEKADRDLDIHYRCDFPDHHSGRKFVWGIVR